MPKMKCFAESSFLRTHIFFFSDRKGEDLFHLSSQQPPASSGEGVPAWADPGFQGCRFSPTHSKEAGGVPKGVPKFAFPFRNVSAH